MKWLYIIDPYESLHPETDTTYIWMKESVRRGIQTYIAVATDIFLDKIPKVACKRIYFQKDIAKTTAQELHALDKFNLIHMRKEPPYDLAYHYAVQLLSFAEAPVVNSPGALMSYNEKLIALRFPGFLPRTIVASQLEYIMNFIKKYPAVVLKALDTYQGKCVKKISREDKEAKTAVENMTKKGSIQIMAQEYLPMIKEGDKRVLILGGKFLGVVNRIPKKGNFLSNFGQGGTSGRTKLTKKELDLVKEIGPWLLRQGIHFAGLDVIDGYLTEINITCPSGIQQLNALEGRQLEREIIDYFLEEVAER